MHKPCIRLKDDQQMRWTQHTLYQPAQIRIMSLNYSSRITSNQRRSAGSLVRIYVYSAQRKFYTPSIPWDSFTRNAFYSQSVQEREGFFSIIVAQEFVSRCCFKRCETPYGNSSDVQIWHKKKSFSTLAFPMAMERGLLSYYLAHIPWW